MNEFIELVNKMRKAQKQYKLFGTRAAKERCNMLECEVDFQLSKYIKEDQTLFLVMSYNEFEQRFDIKL